MTKSPLEIYVIGSNSFVQEMVEARDSLCSLGFDGWIHPDYELIARGQWPDIARMNQESEKAALKRENNYLKVHYKHICQSDAVLVVNLEKDGIKNYIGGNVLIEMGQAYVNDKKIFLLNDIPKDLSYTAEIECMDPVCLRGDLSKINQTVQKEVSAV